MCWSKDLLTMKIRGKRRLTIPLNLGSGNKGVGGIISYKQHIFTIQNYLKMHNQKMIMLRKILAKKLIPSCFLFSRFCILLFAYILYKNA